MVFEEVLEKALKIGTNAEFNVSVDGVSEIMTYIELGTYLITNAVNINFVEINLKN